jgi:hypothetical protein
MRIDFKLRIIENGECKEIGIREGFKLKFQNRKKRKQLRSLVKFINSNHKTKGRWENK